MLENLGSWSVTVRLLGWTLGLFLFSYALYFILYHCHLTKLSYRNWMVNSFLGTTLIWFELFITYSILLKSICANTILKLFVLIVETFLFLLFVNFCEYYFKNWLTKSLKIIGSCFLIVMVDYLVISLCYIGFCHYNIKSFIDIDNLLPKGNGSQLTNKDYLSIFMVIIPLAFSGIVTKFRKMGEEQHQKSKEDENHQKLNK